MRYFGTFGANQTLANCYVVIEAADEAEARAKMFDAHERLWAFIYKEHEYDKSIARWNLAEVPLGTPNARLYD